MKQKYLVNHSFPPFYQEDSKILILGSMPSVKSREEGFYYMHPRNRFWKVVSSVFCEKMPNTLEEKQEFLKRNQIALWDVVCSCYIIGSSDSSISDVVANDISFLLKKTQIEKIYTTGKTAFLLYQKYIYPQTNIEAFLLPSTSPANATMKEEDLINSYQVIRR